MINKLRNSFCCLSPPRIDDQDLGLVDARIADEPRQAIKLSNIDSGTAHRFTWHEIESATGHFSNSSVIGQGGFSTVYLARLCGDLEAAVKLHHPSERLRRAFSEELDVLRRLRHPSIIRLLGFCDDRDEGVLVFERIKNGSLHDKLHNTANSSLTWPERMQIAFDIAGALEYLHEKCELQIIHGDIKSSNILLDENMSAKLIDFGFARMGFSAAVLSPAAAREAGKHMVGSPGYVDPHYLRSGLVSKKSDVYSFGVLLLELVTGMEAIVVEKEQRLTSLLLPEMAAVASGDRTAVAGMVDWRIGQSFDVDEAVTIVSLAAACVGDNPSLRPAMGEVTRIMRENVVCEISAVGLKSNGGELL